MSNKTPLYDNHRQAGGKIVDFAGWQLPINYQSQIEEHHKVRNDAGMFDVSHMTIIDLSGNEAKDFLLYLLANNVARLKTPGKALYSCILNEKAGVIDDLIVYFVQDNQYRMVVNAATRNKDLAWITQHASRFNVEIKERSDLAMIAIQGPNARAKALEALPPGCQKATDRSKFHSVSFEQYFIARTGYTGEDGFEVILPQENAGTVWETLRKLGVQPCGLGARDTLRLEAGMNLYGSDMDETTHPLESGLGWTIAWDPDDRDFIGKSVLATIRDQGSVNKFVGLNTTDKGIFRNHQRIMSNGEPIGIITSGGFSPTLGKAIALARIPRNTASSTVQVEIRNKLVTADIVKPVFVRDGKPCI